MSGGALSQFSQELARYSALADRALAPLTGPGGAAADYPLFSGCIRDYVRCKLMLDPEEAVSDALADLSEISIAKVAGIPKGDVANQDLSMNCAGISSVETKKILLLIALQRALGLSVPPESAPAVKTIEDLSRLLWNARLAKAAQETPA